MDIGIAITLITYAVATVVGFYAILEKNEKKTCELIEKAKQEAQKMHDTQEQRIAKAEEKATKIVDNYNVKFEKVYLGLRELERTVVEKVHDTELSLRSSNHSLAENMSKALNRIELLLAKILPGEL